MQTVWQYVRWEITANLTICNLADVGMRLRNLRRTPVWGEAFLQTLLTWLENDSWSSRVTPKSVISGFWSITVSLITMCKSFCQFLGRRLITWYAEKFPCKRLLLYHSEMLFPSWVKMLSALLAVFATENSWWSSAYMNNLFSSLGRCRSFWKTLQKRGPKADPWGQPLVVAYQSRAFSWLILTLFFLFVNYDRIRVSESSEKPYALSLLISRGGYSESNAFDVSVDKTPTTFPLSTAFFHLSTTPVREVSQFWSFRYAVRLLLNIGSINDVSCLLCQ